MFPTKLMLLTNIWKGYTHLTLRLTSICCKISTLAFPKMPQLISYLTMKDCFPLKIRNKTRKPTLAISIQHCTSVVQCKAARQGEERTSSWPSGSPPTTLRTPTATGSMRSPTTCIWTKTPWAPSRLWENI